MNKSIKLNNGVFLPAVGLGTYKSLSGEGEAAIKYAIDIGYRHFDCAWFYGNEKEVGVAIKAKIDDGTVKREDLFITSKLWNNYHAKKDVPIMIKESLKNLQLDYLDLFLIHWPTGFKKESDPWPINDGKSAFSDVDYIETWEGMEECVKLGLAKSIGVSNFNGLQVERLMKVAKIKPVCNQVEINPNFNQKDLIKYCKNYDIVLVGYCPLKASENVDKPAISDPKIAEIGKKYNKSPAQVILNYLLSLGVGVIPKSVTPSRIQENFDVFDFILNKEDIEYMDSLNRNQRVVPYSEFKDHPYFPFGAPF